MVSIATSHPTHSIPDAYPSLTNELDILVSRILDHAKLQKAQQSLKQRWESSRHKISTLSEALLSCHNGDFRELVIDERKILLQYLLVDHEICRLQLGIASVGRGLGLDCNVSDIVLESMLEHLVRQQQKLFESEEAVKEISKAFKSAKTQSQSARMISAAMSSKDNEVLGVVEMVGTMEERLAQILRKVGTDVLLRKHEKSKPPKRRDPEAIRCSNAAAHKGTALADVYRLHLAPDSIDSEWCKAIYGFDCRFIGEFGHHQMILNPANWHFNFVESYEISPTSPPRGSGWFDIFGKYRRLVERWHTLMIESESQRDC
ncbi:hypothetical protein IFR05_012178 [Cadophora sp. M221]|nr:hypothetical protein IFR05_012178 [Cadophora sp. M221]